jgi:hypothetical protein
MRVLRERIARGLADLLRQNRDTLHSTMAEIRAVAERMR